MALTKQTIIDRIEITETGTMQVRRATYVAEDGVRIMGPSYHRVTFDPGADVTQEDARVRSVANVIWTPAVIQAYRDRLRP
jgi:hypothetical protein